MLKPYGKKQDLFLSYSGFKNSVRDIRNSEKSVSGVGWSILRNGGLQGVLSATLCLMQKGFSVL
jgi:hypothetical protein